MIELSSDFEVQLDISLEPLPNRSKGYFIPKLNYGTLIIFGKNVTYLLWEFLK